MDRSCVWWDDVGLNWSTRGCETIKESSTSTVCLCDHLTNFAIMFGEADPHHPILDPLSVVLLSASCLSILVTQAALAITRFAILDNMMSLNWCNFRKDLRSSMTKFVEDNRNWSLFAAQLSFICFSGLENHVPRVACKMFSILIHYLYMAFFLWTGNVMNTIMNIFSY